MDPQILLRRRFKKEGIREALSSLRMAGVGAVTLQDTAMRQMERL
jgi:hypothetical protein